MNSGRNGMQKRRRNASKMLAKEAEKLAGKGYSVVPIQGDAGAGEPKRPTMKWRAFQRRIADKGEIAAMFDRRAGALGVVCGRVSRLLVIDFDDHVRYQRFCRHLPQYAATYTVKTRRGYHAYYRTDVKVPSHEFDGGDIKGERSYVVAPPSVLAGFEYKAVRRVDVIEIADADVDALLSYFHVRGVAQVAPGKQTLRSAERDNAGMYERLHLAIGRNNALYRCACALAADGMSSDEIESKLLRRYVVSEGRAGHKVESFADRYREGRRTIASALRGAVSRGYGGEGLPNTVRERLLQGQGSSIVARLLDIMFAAGWESERYFYMRDAVDLGGKYGLNRKSVMEALTGELSSYNGRHIIRRRYVEYVDIGGLYDARRGRPARLVFQMPSVAGLLAVLGVSASPSDRLLEPDFVSGHAYRRALHREYVKRLSPEMPMAVLAGRLGISARTLRRYNAELGVQVCQRVGRFQLTWEKLKCLPRRDRLQGRRHTPGYWLEVGESRRYPAWRHVGAALLRRCGDGVFVHVRRASGLSLGRGDVRALAFESMSVELFVQLRVLRGERVGGGGLLGRLREWTSAARSRAAGFRYARTRLAYDTVASVIAEDKVAETIQGYLVAEDAVGAEVRRPARRGVAFRMLKEFGEGNVYLAVRDIGVETLASIARHALRLGDGSAGVRLLARSMA